MSNIICLADIAGLVEGTKVYHEYLGTGRIRKIEPWVYFEGSVMKLIPENLSEKEILTKYLGKNPHRLKGSVLVQLDAKEFSAPVLLDAESLEYEQLELSQHATPVKEPTEVEKTVESPHDEWPKQEVAENFGKAAPGTFAEPKYSKLGPEILSYLELKSSWDTFNTETQEKLVNIISTLLKENLELKPTFNVIKDAFGKIQEIKFEKVDINNIDFTPYLIDIKLRAGEAVATLTDDELIEALEDIPITMWDTHPIEHNTKIDEYSLNFKVSVKGFDDTVMSIKKAELLGWSEIKEEK